MATGSFAHLDGRLPRIVEIHEHDGMLAGSISPKEIGAHGLDQPIGMDAAEELAFELRRHPLRKPCLGDKSGQETQEDDEDNGKNHGGTNAGDCLDLADEEGKDADWQEKYEAARKRRANESKNFLWPYT